MNGRFIVSAIVICAALAGAAMFYLQIYGFYDDVSERDNRVVLTSVVTGAPEEIPVSSLSAIDADSSPIRYRACFQTDQSIGMLTESFELHPKAEPRVAPGWFECFEAEQIGNDLANGNAVAFWGQRNIEYGIDRVVAIYADGRGYVWHEVNDCGDKLYDGSPKDPNCPERD
jgi:hypothetical protein